MQAQHSFDLSNGQSSPQPIELQDACACLYPAFYARKEADALYQRLLTEIPWQQDELQIAGRPIPVPRLQAWFGDPDTYYHYTGLSLHPKPWLPLLSNIRCRLEAETGHRFNSVLLNYYRNGQDSVDWHADDEPELGNDPIIASLTLGTERLFQLRHKQNTFLPKLECHLPHGSLLIMGAGLQRHWKHRVPKQPGIDGARINLTFRLIER